MWPHAQGVAGLWHLVFCLCRSCKSTVFNNCKGLVIAEKATDVQKWPLYSIKPSVGKKAL